MGLLGVSRNKVYPEVLAVLKGVVSSDKAACSQFFVETLQPLWCFGVVSGSVG